jgi:hypothetical protein
MKTSAAILLFALLSSAAGASPADVHVHIDCNASGSKCPPPAPPPALPAIPDVPAAAHAACASKSPGSTLAWTLRQGETMTGVCVKDDGRMVFSLRDYERKD